MVSLIPSATPCWVFYLRHKICEWGQLVPFKFVGLQIEKKFQQKTCAFDFLTCRYDRIVERVCLLLKKFSFPIRGSLNMSHHSELCGIPQDQLPLLFLGNVFGRLRHPSVSLPLFGQPHGIRSSWEISWDLGALISLTSALCVVATVRQWIICCYIVERLIGCGVLSLGYLGFLGFPHVWFKIVYLVGGIGWGSIHLTFGT